MPPIDQTNLPTHQINAMNDLIFGIVLCLAGTSFLIGMAGYLVAYWREGETVQRLVRQRKRRIQP